MESLFLVHLTLPAPRILSPVVDDIYFEVLHIRSLHVEEEVVESGPRLQIAEKRDEKEQ